MATLAFQDARACVIRELREAPLPAVESVDIAHAPGRVLAEAVRADRDYPASTRSVRDGFAVRSGDLPAELRVTGEVRAGEAVTRSVGPGEAIEIMTGAPVPAGADAVIMVEHVEREGDRIRSRIVPQPGEYLNPKGAEARRGDLLLKAGARIGFAEVALLATAGIENVPVYRKPRIAILATGDEIVELAETPETHQIRNSNAHSLAAQVRVAGGEAVILPVARDTHASTRELIERGLTYDLLILSGGVSAGKYDIVEEVLASCGAEFFFDRVLIQPGQPIVFGRARGTLFFGLPGNPAATMVTFEIFARAAVERLGGRSDTLLPVTLARLTAEFRQRPGLTRFLPARLAMDGVDITPLGWTGSSDIPAVARANAFLVTDPGRETWAKGDLIQVLMK